MVINEFLNYIVSRYNCGNIICTVASDALILLCLFVELIAWLEVLLLFLQLPT